MNNQKKKFKILLLNIGYCTGIYGTLIQYIINFYRYIFLPKRIEKNIVNKFKQVIREEKPDLICLIEIKKKRQLKEIKTSKYNFFDEEIKYGKDSILSKLPFLKNNCNAFLSKHKLEYKKHYLKNGIKKLVYEITLPGNISLILFHFSLEKKVREKQIKEINDMFSNIKHKIICGDFNNFGGLSELNFLIRKSDLKISNKKPTFPTHKPKIALDLFLCSKKIECTSKILNNQLSDHLPVVLEYEY